MAYVFNQVNNALGQKQSDVLGQQGAAPQPVGDGAPGQIDKTQGGAAIGSADASAAAPAAKEAPTFQDASKIAEVNKGTQLQGGTFSKTKAAIGDQQAKLQQQANEVAQAKKYDPGDLSADVVKRVGAGDESAIQEAAKFFGSRFQPSFTQNLSQLDTTELNAVNEPGGVKSYLQSKAQGPYTRGQSKLDEAIFGKQIREEAAKLQQQFNQQEVQRQEQARAQAEAEASGIKNNRDARDRAATALRGVASGIQGEAQKAAAAEAARRKGMQTGVYGLAAEAAKPVAQKELENLQRIMNEADTVGFSPQERAELGLNEVANRIRTLQQGVNEGRYGEYAPERYFNLTTPEVSAQDFVTEDQASRFNKIMELLGDPSQRLQAGRATDVRSGLREGEFLGALRQGLNTDKINEEILERKKKQNPPPSDPGPDITKTITQGGKNFAKETGREIGKMMDPTKSVSEALRRLGGISQEEKERREKAFREANPSGTTGNARDYARKDAPRDFGDIWNKITEANPFKRK